MGIYNRTSTSGSGHLGTRGERTSFWFRLLRVYVFEILARDQCHQGNRTYSKVMWKSAHDSAKNHFQSFSLLVDEFLHTTYSTRVGFFSLFSLIMTNTNYHLTYPIPAIATTASHPFRNPDPHSGLLSDIIKLRDQRHLPIRVHNSHIVAHQQSSDQPDHLLLCKHPTGAVG